jgi:transcriptional regulator with XRE-family HTH domain
MGSGITRSGTCPPALISSIEGGRANPTLESLDKVALALDVAVADLLA